MINVNNEKIYDGIMGFVVGDALGVPYEFKKRGTFKCKDMIGYGTHDQPAGTWSDDSSMVLATLHSIKDIGYIDYEDIMQRFESWYFYDAYTPYGEVFDFGRTTALAIENYHNGTPSYRCGGTDEFDNGNGGLMRILPMAFVDHDHHMINDLCSLTHNTFLSQLACYVYIKVATSIINGTFDPKEGCFKTIRKTPKRDVESDGYVMHTLTAALWCFLTTNNYKDCVLKAVNLGNDTDTIAALAGGLAGLMYGVNQIPENWIDQIAKKDWIKWLCFK